MRIHDLLGDRQAQTGVGTEASLRPVGVEALEHALQIVGADAGSAIIDAELDLGADTAHAHRQPGAGTGEGACIVDQVAHHLAQARVMPHHPIGPGAVHARRRHGNLEGDLGLVLLAGVVGVAHDRFEELGQVEGLRLATRQFGIEP